MLTEEEKRRILESIDRPSYLEEQLMAKRGESVETKSTAGRVIREGETRLFDGKSLRAPRS